MCALLSLNYIAGTIISHLRISYTQTEIAILLNMFANKGYTSTSTTYAILSNENYPSFCNTAIISSFCLKKYRFCLCIVCTIQNEYNNMHIVTVSFILEWRWEPRIPEMSPVFMKVWRPDQCRDIQVVIPVRPLFCPKNL